MHLQCTRSSQTKHFASSFGTIVVHLQGLNKDFGFDLV